VTQSQEERIQAAEKKEEVANAKEEERQQEEVTRRVTGAITPYVEPSSVKSSRWSLGVSGGIGENGRGSKMKRNDGGIEIIGKPKRKSKRKSLGESLEGCSLLCPVD
jgi:hypothetical protein